MFETSQYQSIVEIILERLKIDPEQRSLIFIHDDESEEEISIQKLHASACAYAQALTAAGIKPGDIVILALRHCKELIYAFWGTLYIGAAPCIIVYKGPMTAAATYLDRLKEVACHSGSRLLITLPELVAALKQFSIDAHCQVMAVDDIKFEAGGTSLSRRWPYTTGEDLAYLQFTSGTIGMQKGVELSHRAILHWMQSAKKAFQITNSDVIVNWLPLYHDFGLFGGLILPIFCNIPCVCLSPFKWLRNPKILLWLIHCHKGTISFLPNSAHHHMVRSIQEKDLKGLDISSLRCLVNGSEPVFYESQQLFLERFTRYGFRETSLAAGYGMAENTLGATLSPVNERSPVDWVSAQKMRTRKQAVPAQAHKKRAKANVSSGVPLKNMEVAIINEQGRHLADRHIGEIILRSHSLFSGYHNRPNLTSQVMVDGWYRTGDIGYLTAGHLYVCGRKKDLIIVGGHNIHPEDLEAIADTVPGIQRGRVVALGIMDKTLATERIVMICGLERPVSEEEKLNMERDLRQRIHAGLEVTLGEVHFVNKNWVERTQNGKIARGANLEKYKKTLAKYA